MRLFAVSSALQLAAIVGAAHVVTAAHGRQSAPATVIDVPYVAQTGALCGGAALAMIFRYWGQTEIYAEDFAPLVERDEEGIRQDALVAAVRRRGWQAIPFSGTPEAVRRLLGEGRPVLVLIEDRENLYHYVVVTGWVGKRILVHDPARAPFRMLEEEAFYRAWARTGHWSLLILPGVGEEGSRTAESSLAPASIGGCEPLVAEGVRLAREGNLSQAKSVLEDAAKLCPGASGPLREMAGIHFLQREWEDSERLATRSVSLDPEDEHAWRLLGTSRFLQGNLDGALSAFNRVGEPRIDLTRLEGLDRTNHKVVRELLDLTPRALLTDRKLRRARRRLESLPAFLSSRVSFTPQADGTASVEAAIQERPLFVNDRFDLIADAIHAVTERELGLRLASPMHGGELWSLDWRWWEGRPRLNLSLSVPRASGLGSIWQVDASWEEESYVSAIPGGTSVLSRERREHVGFSMQDWTEADFLWEITFSLDRWRDRGKHASIGGAIEKRWARDRMGIRAEASSWASLEGGPSFTSGSLGWSWRSTTGTEGTIWRARAGIEAASERAPRMLWPGAGLGHARKTLLRAHPLLQDGVVAGEIFGPRVGHGGFELERWIASPYSVRVGLVAFVDMACVDRGMSASGPPGQVDVGGGARIKLPGQSGLLRIDAAHGLVDGNVAFSVGWEKRWPGWN
ncbi:MAG TPA: papain-like cysteine protease family protein [Vicinamibacteria bacterium]|nr:papain-like cysteine protease family protein [Vicinamibacteria bacterium]